MSIKTWQERLVWITGTSYQGYASQEEIDSCKQAEIDELRAALARRTGERDALKADAERYRWIRECSNDSLIMYGDSYNCELMMEEELDAAIDAAMKGKS